MKRFKARMGDIDLPRATLVEDIYANSLEEAKAIAEKEREFGWRMLDIWEVLW